MGVLALDWAYIKLSMSTTHVRFTAFFNPPEGHLEVKSTTNYMTIRDGPSTCTQGSHPSLLHCHPQIVPTASI